jgi:adenylate cyclase
MADWGFLQSAGSSREDALNCVRSALLIRALLADCGRNGPGREPFIRTGCGITTGSAPEQGGSPQEAAALTGDAVSLASRTGFLNKALRTDILITEYTWELINEDLIAKEMGAAAVRGTKKPVRIFAVVNMKKKAAVIKTGASAFPIPGAGTEGPRTLEELRELLG